MLPLSLQLDKITKGRIDKLAYKLLKGNIIKYILFLCLMKNRGSDPFYQTELLLAFNFQCPDIYSLFSRVLVLGLNVLPFQFPCQFGFV